MKQRTKDRLISLFLLLGVTLMPLLYFLLALPWIAETDTAGIVSGGVRGLITTSAMIVSTFTILGIVVGIVAAIKIPQHHKKSSNIANFLALLMFSVCLVIAILAFMTVSIFYPVGTTTIPQGVGLGMGAILTGILAIVIAFLYLFAFIFTYIKGQSELELRIDNLKSLLEKHYITNEQFEAGKAKLLEELA